jgi:hypothetical protein
MQATLKITPNTRAMCMRLIQEAPEGDVLSIRGATRTLDQNSKLWPMLNDVAKQVVWYGKKLSADEWRYVFVAALKKQDVVPGLEGGFVVLATGTSKLDKRTFSDLIELVAAFGAEHNVRWSL